MRYAIFSDVHANFEAFEAALNFYKTQAIDKFIFLGDIAGYGANPRETIDLLRRLDATALAGNHDFALTGKLSQRYFNAHAQKALSWTETKLSDADRQSIDFPELTHREKNIACVHGSLMNPADFNYILNSHDAEENLRLFGETILFCGHSHKIGTFCFNGAEIKYSREPEIKVENDRRYIVNVGSVGQPRDGDWRACVCVYDDDKQLINLHRVEYDNDAAAKKILDAGLPKILAERLKYGY